MAAVGATKRIHRGRRSLVILGLGILFIVAGLFVLVDQAFVASQLQPLVGSATDAATAATGGFTPYGSLSYVVYAIGIGLIGTGGGLVRMAFHTSLASYASGGSGMGAMGMSPQAMQGLMASSQAAMERMAAPSRPTVKVKCPSCGSLEEEDAKFCHKCGKPM